MSKISLTTIFITIAGVTIGAWYFVSYKSARPIEQAKSHIVKTATENNRTIAKEELKISGKRAPSNSEQLASYHSALDQATQHSFEDYANAMSNPANYAAIRAMKMRSLLIDNQLFFRNQSIAPDMKQKMIGLLADMSLEQLETVAISNGLQDAAGSRARAALKDEYQQRLNDLLGPEIAARYNNYTTNIQYWKALDTYVAVTADQGTALTDDQKYALACIMSENKTTSLANVKEKVIPLLSSDQQSVFDAYLEEERLIVIGQGIDKDLRNQAIARSPQPPQKNTRKK